MLQIKNIKKEYHTGSLVQKALDNVSLNLRDNEFVAILGPSGSGKSTLLNIIGGLDRYDSGDLIINGVSTKKYKDRDWDSYRNHTIGFIFQSYNLIPHQTVLANVELALTISGANHVERRKRAEEALAKVGLQDQMHKKPNQMSGGQMQRVAIARALVNDPDILLADEPTGALDTETSIQVMDLLKEVAKDRLVVMVTHNPDLANEYANRIVKLKDGKIISDTNPYVLDIKDTLAGVHKNLGHASMSFRTALSLSMNNLMTKKARTILVSFAGSIGIIGIALIMSLSNGVNAYIAETERNTLSEYPLTISSTSYNLTSLMSDVSTTSKSNNSETEGVVKEKNVVSSLLNTVNKNDLKSLKSYLDENSDEINQYAESVEYSYDVTPLIYQVDGDSVHEVNPNKLLSSSSSSSYSSMYSSALSNSSFSQLPSDDSLYADQYTVKAGRWPENYNEVVIVTDKSGSVSDMTLYSLGIKDYSELETLVSKEDTSDAEEDTNAEYPYHVFIDRTLKLVNACDLYSYDESTGIWTDHSSDDSYVQNTVKNSEDLTVVGVVEPTGDSDVTMLTSGINYPSSLIDHVVDKAANSAVVKAQLDQPSVNILTGNTFDQDNSSSDFDYSSLFSIDTSAMASAFSFDTSKIDTNFADYLNTDQLSSTISDMSDDVASQVMSSIQSNINTSQVSPVLQSLLSQYLTYASNDPTTDYANIGNSLQNYMNSESAKQIIQDDLKSALTSGENASAMTSSFTSLLSQIMADLPQYMTDNNLTDYSSAAEQYLKSSDVQDKITTGMAAMITSINISADDQTKIATDLLNGYNAYVQTTNGPDLTKLSDSINTWLSSSEGSTAMANAVSQVIDVDSLTSTLSSTINTSTQQVASSITDTVQSALSQMMSQLPSAFSVDTDALVSAFGMNFNSTELTSMFKSMMSGTTVSYWGNLTSFGYADLDSPGSISIYPTSFEAKDSIKSILNRYNQEVTDAGESDKYITYTDVVGTLMTSVTDIVNTISYVLIAFVAISLVVSSIMIGVITYISVLERNKEIGILRAIGASKHNISQVFNAETFITGALAGIMGIAIASILLIPMNYIIHSLAGRTDINAIMPIDGAIFLICLSIVLTLLGGLIPSKKAAKSDPVKALRNE